MSRPVSGDLVLVKHLTMEKLGEMQRPTHPPGPRIGLLLTLSDSGNNVVVFSEDVVDWHYFYPHEYVPVLPLLAEALRETFAPVLAVHGSRFARTHG